MGLFFQEIIFITELPGSNFLLPRFITGGKWDFQVADLLLATANFEPCIYHFILSFGQTSSGKSFVLHMGLTPWYLKLVTKQ